MEETSSTFFVELETPGLFYIEGEAFWIIEDDSFDYAGTHCTNGQSGTCELPPYATLESLTITQITEYDKDWKNPKDVTEARRKELQEIVEEEVAAQEEKEGDVVSEYIKYHEDLEVEAQSEERGWG